MGAIRTQAAALYAGGVKVSKAGSRSLFGTVEDTIAAAALGLVGLLSWPELEAITGASNNALAVVSSIDVGQHVDPVTGETVDNAGYYRWNAEAPGWQWMSLASVAGGVEVACEITAAGGVWTFTARPGQAPVHPAGLGQTFSGYIPEDADGFSVVVVGVNDQPTPDARPAGFQNADYATTGTLFGGEYVRIAFLDGGAVEILDPAPPQAGGGAGIASAFLQLNLIAHTGNSLHVEPPYGGHPNNTGDGYFGVLRLPDDYPVHESGWAIATAGITMDPIPLEYRDGSDIPGDAIVGGDVIYWSRPGGTGNYQLFQLWRADDAKPGGSDATATEYDRVLAHWAASNGRSALIQGRRNATLLAGNLTAFGGLTGAADTLAYFTGAGALATTALTTQARALLDDTSYSAMRSTLGLAIGADVQAYNINLSAIGALTSAADRLPYATGAGAWSLAPFTSAGRALVDDADAAAQRTTLGLGTMATQAASAVAITGGNAFGLGGMQVTGTVAPAAGSGFEIQGGASVTAQAYNRTGGAYISLAFDASTIFFKHAGAVKLQTSGTGVAITGSMKPSSYTVATVPSASAHGGGSLIHVTDESGGAVPAFSDATNWRRVTDRAVIS